MGFVDPVPKGRPEEGSQAVADPPPFFHRQGYLLGRREDRERRTGAGVICYSDLDRTYQRIDPRLENHARRSGGVSYRGLGLIRERLQPAIEFLCKRLEHSPWWRRVLPTTPHDLVAVGSGHHALDLAVSVGGMGGGFAPDSFCRITVC
jgi:hypothetical protein